MAQQQYSVLIHTLESMVLAKTQEEVQSLTEILPDILKEVRFVHPDHPNQDAEVKERILKTVNEYYKHPDGTLNSLMVQIHYLNTL